jgi:hypothetical protein
VLARRGTEPQRSGRHLQRRRLEYVVGDGWETSADLEDKKEQRRGEDTENGTVARTDAPQARTDSLASCDVFSVHPPIEGAVWDGVVVTVWGCRFRNNEDPQGAGMGHRETRAQPDTFAMDPAGQRKGSVADARKKRPSSPQQKECIEREM